MPGKLKVKIVAGRGLPVMDRSSDSTDAFVEVYFLLNEPRPEKTSLRRGVCVCVCVWGGGGGGSSDQV